MQSIEIRNDEFCWALISQSYKLNYTSNFEFRIAQSAFASNVSAHCGVCDVNLREFVLAISLISFGSNQTFFLPHRITEAASLFWSLRELQKYTKNRKTLLLKLRAYDE